MKPIEEGLAPAQIERLRAYSALLLELNRRHNLVSEAAATHLWEHHIRHCLALTIHSFPAGSHVVDWGTGGGLPGIPLAIVFPQVEFSLVDSVGKKVQSLKLIVRRLGLTNVFPWHGRAEEWPRRAHYAVSRATAPLSDLWRWTTRVIEPVESRSQDWPQGLLALKGGELGDEVSALDARFPEVQLVTTPLEPVLQDPFFRGKVLVHASRHETPPNGP